MKNKYKILLSVVLCIAMVHNVIFATNVINQTNIPSTGHDFKINLSGKKVNVINYNVISETRDNMFKDGCQIQINVPIFSCENEALEEKLNNEVENACNTIKDKLMDSDELMKVSNYALLNCDIFSVTNKRIKFSLKGIKTMFGGKYKKVNVKFEYDIESENLDWKRN